MAEVVKAAPSFAEAYHLTSVPVATKLATVEAPQKFCAAAVGAGIVITSIVCVAVATHCPAVGVKVYSVVAKLLIAGDQVPVKPFIEVVGKASITEREQTAAEATNVGTVFGVTSIVISFLQVTPLTVTSHQ